MQKSLILTGIFIIVFFLAESIGLSRWIHPQKWYILSFFIIFSVLFHRLVENGMKNNREKFIPFYLSTVVLRLILSLVFIGVALYLKITDKFLFVINFFVLYLFYTIFELWNLSRNLRQNS